MTMRVDSYLMTMLVASSQIVEMKGAVDFCPTLKGMQVDSCLIHRAHRRRRLELDEEIKIPRRMTTQMRNRPGYRSSKSLLCFDLLACRLMKTS